AIRSTAARSNARGSKRNASARAAARRASSVRACGARTASASRTRRRTAPLETSSPSSQAKPIRAPRDAVRRAAVWYSCRSAASRIEASACRVALGPQDLVLPLRVVGVLERLTLGRGAGEPRADLRDEQAERDGVRGERRELEADEVPARAERHEERAEERRRLERGR